MKFLTLICLYSISNLIVCFGQEYHNDILFEMREKYSSTKKFNEYCKNRYILCKENSPPPPPSLVLKKIFKIPKSIRLEMFPFNEYDSVVIVANESKDTIILSYQFKLALSDLMFNYSYDGYFYKVYENFDEKNVWYKILFFNTKKNTYKFIEWFVGGEHNTNFTEYEFSQLDIDENKIDKFVKTAKIKIR